MKQRVIPREIKDSRRIIGIDVTDKGMHYFKLPRMKKAAEMILLYQEKIKDSPKEYGNMTAIEFYANFGKTAEDMVSIIGATWYHQSLDLDNVEGEALAEELYEEDYTEYEISNMFSTIFSALISSLEPQAVATRDAPDFLEQDGEEEKQNLSA